MRKISILWLFLLLLVFPHSVHAFQYQSLPSDNLIQNPWFRSSNCQFSSIGWKTNEGEAPWGGSAKIQDPTDFNCNGDWTGFAARFARNAGKEAQQEFYPNKDALLSQVVGPVSPANITLQFHFLFVAHRFNWFKAEIYGSNNVNGPWTSVWIPLDERDCLSQDCANAPYNQYCMQTRECLWDYVTEEYLGSLNPLTNKINQGYPYYKIEFLGNYPEPDSSATGDVGIKVSRVYFKVSNGSTITPTELPTPTAQATIKPSDSPSPSRSASPTNSPSFVPTPVPTPGDANEDGKVNGLDYLIWLGSLVPQDDSIDLRADFNSDEAVDGIDYVLWRKNFDEPNASSPTPTLILTPLPTGTSDGFFTINVADESFCLYLTDSTQRRLAENNYKGINSKIPVGKILPGNGGFNFGYGGLPGDKYWRWWSWYMDPENTVMADSAIEICDALPSYVEYNGTETGTYCPWLAKVTELGCPRGN